MSSPEEHPAAAVTAEDGRVRKAADRTAPRGQVERRPGAHHKALRIKTAPMHFPTMERRRDA